MDLAWVHLSLMHREILFASIGIIAPSSRVTATKLSGLHKAVIEAGKNCPTVWDIQKRKTHIQNLEQLCKINRPIPLSIFSKHDIIIHMCYSVSTFLIY